MKNALVLGAGTAGTIMANRLADRLPEGWQVTVVDKDDAHVYQPGLLLLPFGVYSAEELVRSRAGLLDRSVRFVKAEIDRLDTEGRRVHLADGAELPYDILIVATGVRLSPEDTEGLTGEGWYDTAFDFYTLEGAAGLARKLANFTSGRIIVDTADMPIKCPVAPLEMAFLLDAHFRERGVRDKVEIVYATPLEAAFTKPKASALLGTMMSDRDIEVVTDFVAGSADGAARKLVAYDGRALDYDLLVTVPLHNGVAAVSSSDLADPGGFVMTDKHTLQSRVRPEVFAIGDATDCPTSKAGAVAHFQAEVLIDNVLRYIDDLPLRPDFDGHANCFVETGHGKALLLDFNYTTEPLPGRFPLPGLGPFTLLEDSAVNHWGKLGFRWIYWNVLLKGGDLPLDHRMAMAGKWS
jgi:sulfide:quinone oxidoreductase